MLEAEAEVALRVGVALLGREPVVAHALDRVLRHALVKVSMGPGPDGTVASAEEQAG